MTPPSYLLCFCCFLFVFYQLLSLSVFAAHAGDANSTSSCNSSSPQCANLGNNPYPFWASAACAAAPSYVLSNCTPSSAHAYWHSFSDAALGVVGSPAVTTLLDSSSEVPYMGFASSFQLSWNISLVNSGPCPPDLFSATNLSLYNIPSSINLTRFPDSSALSFTTSNTILLFNCARNIANAVAQLGSTYPHYVLLMEGTGCGHYKTLCQSLAETPCIQMSVDLSTTELMLQHVLDSLTCSHFMFGTPTIKGFQDFTMFTPSVIELLWEDIKCNKCQSAGGQCVYDETFHKKFNLCTCLSDGPNHNSFDPNTQTCSSPSNDDCYGGLLTCSIGARIGVAAAAIVAALGLCVAIRVGFPRFRKLTIPIVIRILKNIVRKLQSVTYRHRHLLDLLDLGGLTERPTEYSYNSIASATKSFNSFVGEGGFGKVYKGMLVQASSGQGGSSIQQQIAVKVLDAKSKCSQKQFLNEVITIGKIHHVNVVRLLGFCMQEDQEMLVYEYLVNGSLDRWVFEKKGKPQESHVLDWGQRYAVALGVARGLSYMHEECRHRTVHCDIKPQNILLDEHMHPKIADFGLARLMSRDESKVVTFAKGTPGYMAPEFWMGGESQLSTKFDVYSYGMVLLELISGQRNFGSNDGSSFPAMAFKAAMEGDVESIVDARLDIDRSNAGDAQKQQIKTAVFVALWCIQDHPARRPHMSEVVKYLEGGAIISEYPPQPTISMSYTASSPQQEVFNLTGSHDYNDCTPLSGGR